MKFDWFTDQIYKVYRLVSYIFSAKCDAVFPLKRCRGAVIQQVICRRHKDLVGVGGKLTLRGIRIGRRKCGVPLIGL